MTAPSSVTLADYRSRVQKLLHDANDTIWPLADKDAYINEAIQMRDLDSGGQRAINTFTLTASQDTYSFADLSAGTFVGVAAGTANVFDVVGITLLYNGTRYRLGDWTFNDLQALLRQFVNTTDVPSAWCRYGAQRIIIAPPPGQAYDVEVDCVIYSIPTLLVASTDPDTLAFPYTYPVPLYAAFLAKQNEGQYDEAEFFKGRYDEAISKINSARSGMTPMPYAKY